MSMALYLSRRELQHSLWIGDLLILEASGMLGTLLVSGPMLQPLPLSFQLLRHLCCALAILAMHSAARYDAAGSSARTFVDGANGLAKACFDRLFALAALILLMPLMTVLALAIKASSPGPVLFLQTRMGRDGRRFEIYKFRSMRVNSEPVRGVTQAVRHDPRLTRVGAFLRRTSLDELPQFFNVLKGDMSVVGPRPHAMEHNELYRHQVPGYMLRHRVKPGVTGWAQIHGLRGETDTLEKMRKRVEFDLAYIRTWSFWLDLRIVAWTAMKGWTGSNAY
jgi:putative colanic acid biosysnthesis UDP-glucose lipid carrier transferase